VNSSSTIPDKSLRLSWSVVSGKSSHSHWQAVCFSYP